jgi:hypothetical protein
MFPWKYFVCMKHERSKEIKKRVVGVWEHPLAHALGGVDMPPPPEQLKSNLTHSFSLGEPT